MAAVTGDEEVACALASAARRAQQRAARASAASAFHGRPNSAATFPSRATSGLRRPGRVGLGPPDRALELIIRSLRLAEEGLRARLLHLWGGWRPAAGTCALVATLRTPRK